MTNDVLSLNGFGKLWTENAGRRLRLRSRRVSRKRVVAHVSRNKERRLLIDVVSPRSSDGAVTSSENLPDSDGAR